MKKYILIMISLVILYGCSNARENDKVMNEESSSADVSTDHFRFKEDTNFGYTEITKSKIQEFIDLNTLAKKHPEIEEIKEQLKAYDKLNQLMLNDSITKITSLTPINEITQVNDSVKKCSFLLTLEGNKQQTTDTIITTITTRKVMIDGIPQNATKITFE